VTTPNPKNIAASVRQKILDKSRAENRPFAELLQYYAMDRFIYRLSQTQHAQNFVLKGALMLRAWHSPIIRPTMDIDLLGKTSNDLHHIAAVLRDVCKAAVQPDGLVFHPNTVRCETITEHNQYDGVRATFLANLQNARVNLQVDIGFGDVVYPQPIQAALPPLLDSPPSHILGYTRESVIAEKFLAMINLGAINSRMKDFYDLWLLARQYSFDAQQLGEAIRRTFANRNTPIPPDITPFSESFAAAKQAQWTAFRRRLELQHPPQDFFQVVAAIKALIGPLLTKLNSGLKPAGTWDTNGLWK